MQSTEGKHYPGLDHIRALAAFLVVVWHFAHGTTGSPVPFAQAPELGLLDEGHVGVSLFMVLSGYLFAKLIAGRSIDYPAFLWNRAIRLLPLLLIVLLVVGVTQYRNNPVFYLSRLAGGAVLPWLPNGGWSITVEAHFYLILPVLLWAAAKWRWALIAMVAAAVCARLVILAAGFEVQDFAYWTIAGRFDQFALGIFFATRPAVRSLWAGLAAAGIAAVYVAFDAAGGFYAGPDWAWTILPTIEAVAFAAIISWYNANPIRSPKMWLVEKAGDASYAIYLLHFFLVFHASQLVDEHVMRLTNLYVALPWAVLFFAVMAVVGHYSYTRFELPLMKRLRKSYIKRGPRLGVAGVGAEDADSDFHVGAGGSGGGPADENKVVGVVG